MSTEFTWVSVPSWVIYVGSDQTIYHRRILLELKNNLVASGGWTVIGSSNHTTYEYEGVTGGGSYGGDSTGPYDVWAAYTDVPRYAQGSGPSWCLLQGPTFEGRTPYLLMGREGTSDSSCTWFTVCDQKYELHPTSPALYMPVVPSGSHDFGRTRFQGYYSYGGTYTRRAFLSMCPETGSFIMPLNLTVRTWFTAVYGFFRLDSEESVEPYMALVAGDANGFGDNTYGVPYLWYAGMPDSIYPDTVSPSFTNNVWDMRPWRYDAQEVYNIDLPTVNFEGEVDLLPLYLGVQYEYGNIEYKCGRVGRILDGYYCPRGLADGDTMEEGAVIQYFKLGPWAFPATVAPVVGP